MIDVLTDAALRCPRPVPEQDLCGVCALPIGLAGLILGKVWGDRDRKRRIFRRRYGREG